MLTVSLLGVFIDRMFANGSIPGRVIPKARKMVLVISVLNNHQLWPKFSSKLAPFLERISLIEEGTRIQQYLDKSYKEKVDVVKSYQIVKLEKM